MMYIITYNINKEKDYTLFFNAIQNSGTWWHYIESTWIISTPNTAQTIYNKISPYINSETDFLLIIKIDPWELMFLHASYHMREIIIRVGLFTIGIDTDESDTAVLKFLGCRAGDLIGAYYIRTMVACEKNNERVSRIEVLEAVVLTVCCGKIEIGSFIFEC